MGAEVKVIVWVYRMHLGRTIESECALDHCGVATVTLNAPQEFTDYSTLLANLEHPSASLGLKVRIAILPHLPLSPHHPLPLTHSSLP